MKKFIFILFFILFLVPDVYASEFNMNNYTSATLGGTKNRYRGVEIVQTGMPGTFTFGTRYTGKLSTIETYFDYPFEANTTYILTYNMNTEDFRNNFSAQYWWDCDDEMNSTNQHVGSLSYISYKKVKFSFKPSENTTCIRVLIGSANQSSQAITGISNWRLDSITLYDPAYQSGSSGGQGSTPSPTSSPNSATNQDIINNQNDNTQDIINNQNDNTQDIIENNNQNTEDIINNQNKNTDKQINSSCSLKDYTFEPRFIGYICQPNGNLCTNENYFASDFVYVNEGYTYNIDFKNISGMQWGYMCWYNGDELISCSRYLDMDNYSVTMSVTAPETATKLSVTFRKNSGAVINGYLCSNPSDDINNTLKDDNIDDKTSFFTDFQDNDHGLTSIITLPLTTIQSLTNSSCVALSVPIPFTNESVNLPCMSEVYQNYIPSIYNIWQVVSFGLISYFICLDIYKMVKGFKDPNEDKVEVLDL